MTISLDARYSPEHILERDDAIRMVLNSISLEQDGRTLPVYNPVNHEISCLWPNECNNFTHPRPGLRQRGHRDHIPIPDKGRHAPSSGAKPERQTPGQHGLHQIQQCLAGERSWARLYHEKLGSFKLR